MMMDHRAMTTNFVALDEKMTAQEAIDSLRAMSLSTSDAVLYLYVVDEHKRLTGVVPIRRLVTAFGSQRNHLKNRNGERFGSCTK